MHGFPVPGLRFLEWGSERVVYGHDQDIAVAPSIAFMQFYRISFVQT